MRYVVLRSVIAPSVWPDHVDSPSVTRYEGRATVTTLCRYLCRIRMGGHAKYSSRSLYRLCLSVEEFPRVVESGIFGRPARLQYFGVSRATCRRTPSQSATIFATANNASQNKRHSFVEVLNTIDISSSKSVCLFAVATRVVPHSACHSDCLGSFPVHVPPRTIRRERH